MIGDIVALWFAVVVLLVFSYTAYKDFGTELVTALVFLSSLALAYVSTTLTLSYIKGERLVSYMKVIDYEREQVWTGKFFVTQNTITFYDKGLILKCDVDNDTYNLAVKGEKEFYVEYIRDKSDYFCKGIYNG